MVSLGATGWVVPGNVGSDRGIAALTVVVSMGKKRTAVMKRVNNFGPTAIMLFAGGGKDFPGQIHRGHPHVRRCQGGRNPDPRGESSSARR